MSIQELPIEERNGALFSYIMNGIKAGEIVPNVCAKSVAVDAHSVTPEEVGTKHTVYSHGKGQIIDNAIKAKEKGLAEVGITDHGFSHPAFGLRKRKLPSMKNEIKKATESTGVKVLLGIESNIIGTDGTVDLKEKYYDDFDLFLAGFHKFVLFKPSTAFSMFVPDMFHSYIMKKNLPKSLIDLNTKTFINVIKKNPVDVITHLNFFCFADVKEVAKVASDYGTYIELNSKKIHFTLF